MTRIVRTDISRDPEWVIEVADTDVTTKAFTAPAAISAATAVLTRLDTLTVPDGVTEGVVTVVLATPAANVTVRNLIRGREYELAVTCTLTAGGTWSATLGIRCVA